MSCRSTCDLQARSGLEWRARGPSSALGARSGCKACWIQGHSAPFPGPLLCHWPLKKPWDLGSHTGCVRREGMWISPAAALKTAASPGAQPLLWLGDLMICAVQGIKCLKKLALLRRPRSSCISVLSFVPGWDWLWGGQEEPDDSINKKHLGEWAELTAQQDPCLAVKTFLHVERRSEEGYPHSSRARDELIPLIGQAVLRAGWGALEEAVACAIRAEEAEGCGRTQRRAWATLMYLKARFVHETCSCPVQPQQQQQPPSVF